MKNTKWLKGRNVHNMFANKRESNRDMPNISI